MFFNISNHPCHTEKTTWSQEQIAAAAEIAGEVIDMPIFSPSATTTDKEIADAARRIAKEVVEASNGQRTAAMVAGEYCTTIRIIGELQARGIACYFGKTERVVEEREENGEVVVVHKFLFCGWRKAPSFQLM